MDEFVPGSVYIIAYIIVIEFVNSGNKSGSLTRSQAGGLGGSAPQLEKRCELVFSCPSVAGMSCAALHQLNIAYSLKSPEEETHSITIHSINKHSIHIYK